MRKKAQTTQPKRSHSVSERQWAEAALRRTEELYRRAIAGADAVPYAYDYRTHTYQFIGQGIEELIGYKPEEITPALWQTIIRESVMGGATAGLSKDEAARRVKAGELREWRCDMEVVTRDGKTRWLSDSSVQNVDESGNVIGSMGILQDITERKMTEAALARERDLLRTLLDNFPDTIYFKDLQSRFVRVSRSKLVGCYELAKQLHRSAAGSADGPLPPHLASLEQFAENLPGKTDFDFFPEPRARACYEDEQEIIRTGQPVIGKLETGRHTDGHTIWFLTSKLPWRDQQGNIIGTFGASKDITQLKTAEAKLEAAHKELVAISRQAGMAEVATSVLHNVGNVLNSVNVSAGLLNDLVRASRSGDLSKVVRLLQKNRQDLAGFFAKDSRGQQVIAYLEALAQQLASEKEQALAELQALTRNVEHIKEIVAMQQSYAKASGLVEFQSLAELVEDAVRMHTAALERHKVQVVRKFEPLPELLLDKHKILQILVNLISNAKYALSDSDAAERRLTLAIRKRGEDKVEVAVCDNGIGIAPENLTRIFAHGFTTRSTGHGFGLHSGALAAREMGGALRAESHGMGRGATFTLELPMKTRAPEPPAH